MSSTPLKSDSSLSSSPPSATKVRSVSSVSPFHGKLVLSTPADNIILQGNLLKLSDYLKYWNVRYFILENSTLYYYVEKPSSINIKPKNIILLTDIEVKEMKYINSIYQFEIYIKSSNVYMILGDKSNEYITNWRDNILKLMKGDYTIEKNIQLENDEFNERFKRLPIYAQDIYDQSLSTAPNWTLQNSDAMVSLYYNDSSFLKINPNLIGLKIALDPLMVVPTISLLAIGIFWTLYKEAADIKIHIFSYYCAAFILIYLIAPSFIFNILNCLLLAPLLLNFFDENAGNSFNEFLMALGRYHYKASVRVDKTPDFLLRLLTSYSFEYRHYCDLNLCSAELLERFSRTKSIGRLVYNSAIPNIIANRDLVLEQEWFYCGKSTYIICEKSVKYSKCKPANDIVRANYKGGIVITLVKTKSSWYSLVTVIGDVDLNSYPVVGLIAPVLVPLREPKSIFALEANIKIAPAPLLENIDSNYDSDIEEKEDKVEVPKVSPAEMYRNIGREIVAKLKEFATGTEEQGWEFVSINNDVHINRKKMGPGINPAVRGKTTLQVAPIYVLDLLTDLSRRNQVDSLFDKGACTHRINGALKIDRLQYKAVWPTTARDFCVLGVIHEEENGNFLLGARSVEHDTVPEDPNNYVRAEVIVGGYYIEVIPDKPDACNITYVSCSDTKGNLPASIVQSVSLKQPMICDAVKKRLADTDLSKVDLTLVKDIIASAKADSIYGAITEQLIQPADAKSSDFNTTLSTSTIVSTDSTLTENSVNEDHKINTSNQDTISPDEIKNKYNDMETPNSTPDFSYDSISDAVRNSYYKVADKALSSLLELSASSDESWTFLHETNDVRVFSRDVKGSDLKCFKGVGVVDASPDTILSLISDPSRRYWYDEMCLDSRTLLNLDSSTKLVYNCFEARSIFCNTAAREFVMIARFTRLPDGTTVIAGKSVDSELCPINTHFVRGTINSAGWVIRPSKKSPNRSLVSYIMHIDLGGSVPTWIANLVSDRQPLCIDSIRKLFVPN